MDGWCSPGISHDSQCNSQEPTGEHLHRAQLPEACRYVQPLPVTMYAQQSKQTIVSSQGPHTMRASKSPMGVAYQGCTTEC